MVIKAAIVAAMVGAARGMIDDGCHVQGSGQIIGTVYGNAAPAPSSPGSSSYPTGSNSSSSCHVCSSSGYLPKYLENNPMAGGYPWGGLTCNNTNPLGGHMAPDTGVTRSFDWYIRRATGSPDGVQKDMLLVNDLFPGPAIEANWGDWIEVTVENKITDPEEGTALHWHGFLMTGTPEMDGVPGVTQCPIAPGQSFTYRFQATLYGSSWWHSHYSAQYSGGAFGPMIVYGPSQVDYDIDVGAIMLSDYYHRDYFSIVEQVMEVVPIVDGAPNIPAIIPIADNNLINGKNDFDCSTITDGTPCTPPENPFAEFQFTPGKMHRLRLVNAGSDGVQKFSIDDHELLVFANDFTPIVPYTTKIVTLAVGQRTDVIVQGLADGSGSYWMRANLSSCAPSLNSEAKAIIHYDDSTDLPTTEAWEDTTDPCANDDLATTVPWYPVTPSEPETTVTIDISATINATGHFVWTMNASSFRANYNFPTLLLSNAGNNSYPFDPQWNVYNFGSNSSMRFILNNKSPAAHPMHLHGHTPFILNAGLGEWDGTIINPENPQRRDTQQILVGGYGVFQIDADNPGVWPFHCHISWHVSGGLYINVMERPADIANFHFGDDVVQTCRDWASFTNTEVPNQIDSGE